MIQLFPKLRSRMLLGLGIVLALAAVLLILYPGASLLLPAVVVLLGAALVFFFGYTQAVTTHNNLLGVLYNRLDADSFVKAYEPLTEIRVRNPNVRLMVRLHLSNAYCALGRFDDAAALLSSIDTAIGKKPEAQLLSRFAVVSNLCYFALQKGDAGEAKRQLDELTAVRKQLEALQQQKPEKKRIAFSTALNEQCYALLTGGKVDPDQLRTQVRSSSGHPLQQLSASLWVARAYLARNKNSEAVKLLEQLVSLAPALHPGRAAAKLLDELPEEAKAKK